METGLLRVLAATGKLFGTRPSELLAIADPVLALEVDLAAAEELVQEARREMEPERNLREISL